MRETVGRGTWLDKVASRIIAREEKLGRSTSILRVESGLSASGIPHIGSLGDAVRAYGIKLALEDLGYKSALIAFSDDLDALRRVPTGLPESLKKYIGHPVSSVPDPFDCHSSYGEHMTSMLRDVLDELGLKYEHRTGAKTYASRILNQQILRILENAQRIGRKIAEMLGQTKFEVILPYFPICENCGRIALAQSLGFLHEEKRVTYHCRGGEIGRQWVDGCGHKGEADITAGKGKLSWKGEFAARWAALDIRFEAYGKDLADSVKVNDWVCQEILDFPPPYHIRYEHFLFGGKKLSKSIGNVFTPQTWLRYGTRESLMLLMFKRIVGTRNLTIEEIPKYVDEYDSLEDTYFGRVKIDNQAKLMQLKGLYEYVNHLKPPSKPSVHAPYRLLVQLASVAPKGNAFEFISRRLASYNIAKEIDSQLSRRIQSALNWTEDFKTIQKVEVKLHENEKKAISALAGYLKTETDSMKIQSLIFEVARRYGLEPAGFFKTLYRILVGQDKGPRLGPYIADIGPKNTAQILLRRT